MSNRVITIHQPDFMPWLGFFDRWRHSDLYMVLDDAQFLRRGWHHRDKVKTSQGIQWLTVPVMKKDRSIQSIRDVIIDEGHDWRNKHLGTLRHAYGKAPQFHRVFHAVEEIYQHKHERLMDLNMELLKLFARIFAIDTPLVLASSLGVSGTSTQRLLDLVREVGGNVYLTGLGARHYLDEGPFQRAGIRVWWQQYQHPVYPQLHGSFVSMLSAIDYLMMLPTTAPQNPTKGPPCRTSEAEL